jgi:tight adherence protein B
VTTAVALLVVAAMLFVLRGSRRSGRSWPGELPASEPGTAEVMRRAHRLRWHSRRHPGGTEQPEAEALELLDALAPALRAGLAPAAALRLVTESVPSRAELTWLADTAARGDPLAPGWMAYAEAVDSDDLRLVAAAWSLCETLGSPLAPTVATVCDAVRRRRAVRRRIAAAVAGPQATMRVLTALPLSGPFVALAVGVAPSELYARPAGAASLVSGLLLLMLGRVWAARMVRVVIAERPVSGNRRHRRAGKRRPASERSGRYADR